MNSQLPYSSTILVCLILQCLFGCTRNEADSKVYTSQVRAFALSSITDKQLFQVDLKTESGIALPINQFHNWVLTVKDVEGSPVYPAQFIINGGMPDHGHGLPTQPQITKHLGEGQYLLEGMKFNMSGKWVLRLKIIANQTQDAVEMTFNVSN